MRREMERGYNRKVVTYLFTSRRDHHVTGYWYLNGAPDCLAGLAFIFTEQLTGFSRSEASGVAKRFGGCV